MESEIIKKLLLFGDAGVDAALVTIIRTLGSTPRNPGAKMLVLPDGSIYGTIGGGCGEAEVRREALAVLLDSKVSKKFRLELTNDVAAGDGMICGGVFEVFIDFISHEDSMSKQVFSDYLESFPKKENPVLATIIGSGTKEENLGRKMVFLPGKKEIGDLLIPEIAEQVRKIVEMFRGERKIKLLTVSAGEINNVEVLLEPAHKSPQLLILGGGHIAKQIVKMASILGYNTTVVDDRPFFANTARFPEADQVVCQDFNGFIKDVKTSPDTFVVIVTRGHQHDLECLREVVDKPSAYIGMIGSRRKVKEVLKQLESEGVSAEKLNKVYSPIGIDIGSETSEEIALSILAEIVSVWRYGNHRFINNVR
jgi:xanthine dehydrogenase accessory factor